MSISNKDLKRRIIEISYKHKLSHLGSCLTAVDIIEEIYSIKKPDEKFVLSAGHAHLAHLVVMEKHNQMGDLMPEFNAEWLLKKHGIHCERNAGCDCSTGSLGQGLPIAVGMALADRSKNVYCLISDGECSEGSIWEALRIMLEQNLTNLHVYLNLNGWGAYKEIKPITLTLTINQMAFFNRNKDGWIGREFVNFRHTDVNAFPFLKGQDAHYHVMSEEDYKQAMEVLNG